MNQHRSAPRVHLALGALLLAAAACSTEDDRAPSPAQTGDDVIRSMGHGRFLGEGWKLLDPSPELFERTQRSLLNRLTAEAKAAGLDVDAARARVAAEQPDAFLANADLIDWLVEQVQPGDHATLKTVNIAMRREYAKTLPPGTAGAEVSARVTFNSGQKYIDECRAAGVPIPPPMYRTGPGNWIKRGSLTTNFLGSDAQLWEYRSDEGICLALPRYLTETSGGLPFGVICLRTAPGAGTNKACFWDNPAGVEIPRDIEAPLETAFVGGYDLETNGQGVCTDCHAGANPFVVHPGDPKFATIARMDQTASGWYEPIVHSNWPQNRGPSNLLAGVPSTGRCDVDGCHASMRDGGRAGQFPILSTELPKYCDTILARAAGIFGGPAETMPPGAAYEPHRTALRDACRSKPDTGQTVPSPSPVINPTFVSPPTLQAVAYDCAQKVEVNNVVLGATVTLKVNTTSYVQVANNVHHIEFTLSAPLAIGDVITASQNVGGVLSGMATLTVRDHHLDYPMGLPAPAINPDLIYECADVIAVTNVPGAKVTVFTSANSSPVTGWSSTGWSSFYPGTRPFIVGDTFSASQSLCPVEPASPVSEVEVAVAAPSALPAPTFDPARAYAGQQLVTLTDLVNGARTKLQASGSFAGEIDVPISWWPDFNLSLALGRALNLGETVTAEPRLCGVTGPITTIPVSKCAELPAPRIETPVVAGAMAVVVSLSQPGARIRVYDAAGIEIGNGSGTVIILSRALVANEAIRVVQEVGSCRSSKSHKVFVSVSGQP